MIMKVFSVYDSKSQVFSSPFFSPQIGSALRSFSDAVNDSQTPFFRHPTDFVLYQVGEWDDNLGGFTNVSPHLHLGVAKDFKTPEVKRAAAELSLLDAVKPNGTEETRQ